MVIHVFIAHMGIGGAERVCVNLANEWTRLGHEVHIAVLNLKDDINTRYLDEKVQVHSLNVDRLRYAFLPFVKYVRRYKPRFMLVFGIDAATIIQKLRDVHLIRLPLVLRVLNNVNISLDKEDGISPVVENYLNKAQSNMKKMEHIVAQCEAMARQLIEKGLVTDKECTVICNPVSERLIEEVNGVREKERVADNCDSDGKDVHEGGRDKEIVFIGRIDPQKDPVELVRAYAGVRAKRDDVILRFVGEGVLHDAAYDEAVRLNVADKVIFDGIRTDMENVYAHADVVALTSKYEGMPNCLIEAIGCGIPVVSYDCPIGPAEIVVPGENGYLIPMGDTAAMSEALLKTLEQNWDRKRIESTCDKFRVTNIAEKYIEIFTQI